MDIYKQIEKYNQIYKMLKNYWIKKGGAKMGLKQYKFQPNEYVLVMRNRKDDNIVVKEGK